MKGRPRLVEEGIPIYGPGSEATPDHRMNGNVINHRDINHSSSSASASNDNHSETASSVKSPQHSSLSSLAAAAKSSSVRPYSSNRPKGRRHPASQGRRSGVSCVSADIWPPGRRAKRQITQASLNEECHDLRVFCSTCTARTHARSRIHVHVC